MSETKHTPGPWYWCDGEDKKDLPYLTSESGKICEFGNWEAYYPHCGELPNEADARLIAAAPEMYEALRHLAHNARASGAEMGLALVVAYDVLNKIDGGGDA